MTAQAEGQIEWLRDAANEQRGIWARHEKMTDEIKNRLFGQREALLGRRADIVKNLESLKDQVHDIDRQLYECACAARVFNIEWPELPRLQATVPRRLGTVQNLIIERLKAAGPNGIRASEIREEVETTLGRKLHQKTVGMYLFRLKKAGLSSRDDGTQVWRASTVHS